MNTQNQRLRFVKSKLGHYTVSFQRMSVGQNRSQSRQDVGVGSVEWYPKTALRWGRLRKLFL